MGLKDGDFDRDWQAPSDQPRPWTKQLGSRRVERIGWTWARKEIENYLIDPEVVARALGGMPRRPTGTGTSSIAPRARSRTIPPPEPPSAFFDRRFGRSRISGGGEGDAIDIIWV